MNINTPETILITGANGYLALHIIQKALERGWNVVGTVRSQKSASKVHAVFKSTSSPRLSLFNADDIAEASSFQDAFENSPTPITTVINAASPLVNNPKDLKTEFLDPAINGGIAILTAIKSYGHSVHRIIHVGSFSASMDLSKGDAPGKTYTPEDWNPLTRETAATSEMAAYMGSKALAERAMWDWIRDEKPTFDMVSINPGAIFGPHVVGLRGEGAPDLNHLNVSSAMLWELVVPSPTPSPYSNYHLGCWVDVRDVGDAILAAVETPEAGGERFLAVQRTHWQYLREAARSTIPELAERIGEGDLGAGERAKDITYDVDGSKIEKLLGVKYRGLDISMKDSYEQMLEIEKAVQ